MATQTLTHPAKYDEFTGERSQRPRSSRERHWTLKIVHALASLKLTVALLAMSVFLVLVGTLAQVDMGMWDVLETYFASYFTWINIRVFFPPSFFPEGPTIPNFYFPFFGGATIGLAMIVNLLAAHALRFRIQAKGIRLVVGLITAFAGIGITWLVIVSGHNPDGVQGQPLFQWSHFWTAIQVSLVAMFLALWYPLVKLLRGSSERWIEAILLSAAIDGLAVLLAWIYSSNAQLDEPSMRILWQLIQGLFAALVLLGGCWALFRKRAGIVLIHGGILLMMFGQYVATVFNVEQHMEIHEGQTQNYAYRMEKSELAIVDPSPKGHDSVVVIPQEILQRSLRKGTVISNDQLPVDVRVLSYFKNSDLEPASGKKNFATAGLGQQFVAVEKPLNSGAESSEYDLASAYVQFRDKSTGRVLSTHLVSYLESLPKIKYMGETPFMMAMAKHAETITIDDRSYQVSLRPQRFYKPYTVKLLDVVRQDYEGTSRPRDYRSMVHISDPTKNVDREARIWMNNPLRFAGETFYQTSWGVRNDGVEITTLSVVRNVGWMTPYVACMIVAVGLTIHFWGALLRFLTRRERELFAPATTDNPYEAAVEQEKRRHAAAKKRKQTAVSDAPKWPSRLIPLAVVTLGLVWLLTPAIPRGGRDDRGIDIHGFGDLPVLYEGRVKPLDSLARNALRVVSNSDSFKDASKQRQPAIRWLLDVISGSEDGLKHKVIRIENLDVLASLDLERRKGLRYSFSELQPHFEELQKQIDKAEKIREQDKSQLTIYDRKVLELHHRLAVYFELMSAFRTPELPAKLPMERLQNNRELTMAVVMAVEEALGRSTSAQMQTAPRAVPTSEGEWQTAVHAWALSYRDQIINMVGATQPEHEPKALNEGALLFQTMMQAYREDDAKAFNAALRKYQAYVGGTDAKQYNDQKVAFEAYFNRFAPFFHAQWAYVFAGVLAAIAWLGWSKPLNRASFWLIVLTLIVHTFALGARIYISGRPPVTNLYSSAVFIGWAGAIFGLSIEVLYRLGIGNVLAAVSGFSTLIIAAFLSLTGETMGVLEAVLDTQFWLSTHVVTVTLGYAATFVAGLIGLIYILRGLLTKGIDADIGRSLIRMMYGCLCFALLFSFVGTVLGGLWADDSWGRFWGWDPKENGALIIVLWNALVLHARWDRMISDRGFAALAVGGNITTAWSWFGVNELGVGLHSYGFTEGVLLALGIFVLSQLAVIAASMIPLRHWRSGQAMTTAAE